MKLTAEQADERRKMVWEMRQSGMTLAAIGKEIGRSKEQVRVIACQHNRLERERAKRRAALQGLTVPELMRCSILQVELPVRARNFFRLEKKVLGIDYTIADVMAMSDEELCFPNFGKVTIAATRAAINEAIANARKVDRHGH